MNDGYDVNFENKVGNNLVLFYNGNIPGLGSGFFIPGSSNYPVNINAIF
jgi:hypothetical protein